MCVCGVFNVCVCVKGLFVYVFMWRGGLGCLCAVLCALFFVLCSSLLIFGF